MSKTTTRLAHARSHLCCPFSRGAVLSTLAIIGVFLAGCSRPSKQSVESARASDVTGAVTDTTAPTSAERGPASRDYRSVAEKVVEQSARVREGDVVLVSGSDEDLPLLEDIAVEVRKRGASPIVTVATERLSRRMFDEVPAKYDTMPPRAALKLAQVTDVFIATEAGEGRTTKGVPPERLAARAKAFGPVFDLSQKRGVRQVFLGNGLYPTEERADQFGISKGDLGNLLYGGIDIDYAQLQSIGEQVRKVLAGGKELHITSPNGTDLRVRIANRPVFVSDGIISPEDQRRGGAATTVWLPAGDVYLAPVPGTAEGVVVADQDYYQGQRIEGARLEFKGGKLSSMTAKSGLEPLRARYDAAGPGKDALGVIDLGINPNLRPSADKPIHAWSRAGMVTVVVGNNTWAGGQNNVNFDFDPYLPNATVVVDGRPLIQEGKLVMTEKVTSR
jgi:aminopeptidase